MRNVRIRQYNGTPPEKVGYMDRRDRLQITLSSSYWKTAAKPTAED
jgi:hypothetical protein